MTQVPRPFLTFIRSRATACTVSPPRHAGEAEKLIELRRQLDERETQLAASLERERSLQQQVQSLQSQLEQSQAFVMTIQGMSGP